MFAEANVVGLFRTLLIFLLIYGAIRIFVRFVLPWLTRWFMRKAQQRMQENMRQARSSREKVVSDDGKVKITYAKTSTGTSTSGSPGEYVDYEELR